MGKTQMWRLSIMLLNKQWVIKEIKEEIQKYLENNENTNKIVQNNGDAGKVVLRGKSTSLTQET